MSVATFHQTLNHFSKDLLDTHEPLSVVLLSEYGFYIDVIPPNSPQIGWNKQKSTNQSKQTSQAV